MTRETQETNTPVTARSAAKATAATARSMAEAASRGANAALDTPLSSIAGGIVRWLFILGGLVFLGVIGFGMVREGIRFNQMQREAPLRAEASTEADKAKEACRQAAQPQIERAVRLEEQRRASGVTPLERMLMAGSAPNIESYRTQLWIAADRECDSVWLATNTKALRVRGLK